MKQWYARQRASTTTDAQCSGHARARYDVDARAERIGQRRAIDRVTRFLRAAPPYVIFGTMSRVDVAIVCCCLFHAQLTRAIPPGVAAAIYGEVAARGAFGGEGGGHDGN